MHTQELCVSGRPMIFYQPKIQPLAWDLLSHFIVISAAAWLGVCCACMWVVGRPTKVGWRKRVPWSPPTSFVLHTQYTHTAKHTNKQAKYTTRSADQTANRNYRTENSIYIYIYIRQQTLARQTFCLLFHMLLRTFFHMNVVIYGEWRYMQCLLHIQYNMNDRSRETEGMKKAPRRFCKWAHNQNCEFQM